MPSSSSKHEKKTRNDKKFLKELKKKEKKRKKLKEREKEKEKKRAKYRSETSSESESDLSDMDLDKEVHPISHYINDRPEMINQVFATITGSKLRSMLPPSLVDLDIDDLKAICLDQLIGMSKRRLQHVLAGQEMLESSGSDSDTEEEKKAGDSDSEDDAFKVVDGKGTVKRTHKIAFGKKEAEVPVKKVILSVKANGATEPKPEDKKEEPKEKEEDGEHGRTLMELLELEMRARAIKALLIKAGKDEGEAETLAIEEALDEAKKKEEKVDQPPPEADVKVKEEDKKEKDEKPEASKEEAEPADTRIFNSENKAMNKAREMLALSENKKIIETEIKNRKEQEALFLYEEQMRKERMEAERLERERLAEEAKERKRKLVEKEQEERRKILEKERDKMIEDHKRKEEMKKNKDKEKLLSKIRAMKEAEEQEREQLEKLQQTKMRKVKDEDGEEDDGGDEAKRKYRRKEDATEMSGDEDGVKKARVRKQYDREDQDKKKTFSRSDDTATATRPKRKVVGGSDVEDGEVEDVHSDGEDEVDREDENMELLQKMKNLKNKISSKMESEKKAEKTGAGEGGASPKTSASSSSGRGRGGRGRGRAGRGVRPEEKEWSLNKYDFEAPDVAETVKDHKPNIKRTTDDKDEDGEKETMAGNKKKTKSSDGFKKVSREEWDKMSRAEKKEYMKERKKRKAAEAVYIKDDSDNEQLVSSGDEDAEEELELSSSEDEKEREERLAKAALKSYAQSFTATEHPEDYQLVMRKDVWEQELAAENEHAAEFDTLEDIEHKDKLSKVEIKEKEKKEKLRAERLKRMQAFQASSVLQQKEEEEKEDKNPFYSSYNQAIEGDEKANVEDPLLEERLKRQKEVEEDEAALKKMEEQEEEEEEEEEDEEDVKARQIQAKLDAKKRKMAELALMKSRKRRPDPNNPSKEEIDVAQELDQMTWEERWKNDQKLKEVFTSSKLLGKAKMKMKVSMSGADDKKQESKPASAAASVSEPREQANKEEKTQEGLNISSAKADTPPPAQPVKQAQEAENDDETNKDMPGMIGSVDEYATILGKTTKQLAQEVFQPPEVSESEGEESPAEDEGDLWGAIMGGS